MTFDEMLKMKPRSIRRKRMSDDEHRLQRSCFRWFNIQYPKLKGRLFAVPNGGRRDAQTGARLKEEGVVAGVADMILLKPNQQYGALLVEMKAGRNRQTLLQKQWERNVTADGEYKYIVCRSIEGFRKEITDYLRDYKF